MPNTTNQHIQEDSGSDDELEGGTSSFRIGSQVQIHADQHLFGNISLLFFLTLDGCKISQFIYGEFPF